MLPRDLEDRFGDLGEFGDKRWMVRTGLIAGSPIPTSDGLPYFSKRTREPAPRPKGVECGARL